MNTRRALLQKTLSGAGLASLATGLPAAFLRAPAAYAADACVERKRRPHFLIAATSGAGDPLNANAPGCYEAPEIVHPADPMLQAAPVRLGERDIRGARVWTTLPDWVRDRACFFHHAAMTSNHADYPKALTLMGGTNRQEQVTSIAAKLLYPCLQTLQRQPIAVSSTGLMFDRRPLPSQRPLSLKDMLRGRAAPKILALRDRTLDQVSRVLRQQGTPAQRRLLDELALTRVQARKIPDTVLSALDTINADNFDGQVTAAIALLQMRAAPVIAVSIGFGGDNHDDAELAVHEVPGHLAGVKSITTLMERLRGAGFHDDVTFVWNTVFGRTLRSKGTRGRDHWANHNVSVLIGPNVRPGVVGGLRVTREGEATGIDSTTGAAVPGGGDVSFADTLYAFGRTLAAAVGVPDEGLAAELPRGKVIAGALRA
jgi:hypothetical protein